MVYTFACFIIITKRKKEMKKKEKHCFRFHRENIIDGWAQLLLPR